MIQPLKLHNKPIIDLFLKCMNKKQYCYYSGFRTNGTTFTFKVSDERVWGKWSYELNQVGVWDVCYLTYFTWKISGCTQHTCRIRSFLLDIGIVSVELSKVQNNWGRFLIYYKFLPD